jgi:hypothetical protein
VFSNVTETLLGSFSLEIKNNLGLFSEYICVCDGTSMDTITVNNIIAWVGIADEGTLVRQLFLP